MTFTASLLVPLQKEPYGLPTHLAQQEHPWSRLNNTQTLASSRREVYHNDVKAPSDSLDFVLKAQYDHHKEFLHSQSQTRIQTETLGHDHG